jgi:hypothetical protein
MNNSTRLMRARDRALGIPPFPPPRQGKLRGSFVLVQREAQRQESDSLHAPASNRWSCAPRIRSHKIAAGSPKVNGMFANRLTIFT